MGNTNGKKFMSSGRHRLFIWLPLALTLPIPALGQGGDDVETLRQELETLQRRVQQMEEANAQAVPDGLSDKEEETIAAYDPPVTIGGALSFNLVHRNFDPASETKYGEGGFDVFRLNVEGEINNILISTEYRFYAYMHAIQHGWIGYRFSDDSELQFGITQVPFGLLPYAAHNSWFGVPYYTGMADDYDMGIKYQRQDGAWQSHIAFFKNEELNDATNTDRYSFDLIREGDQQNEESNQLNGRLAYTFGLGTGCETELGASAEAGQVYNQTTDENGDHWAAALHLDSRCGRWNFQLQAGRYQYQPENPPGVDSTIVRLGAFAGTYDIAGEGDLLVANLAYNFASPWEFVDSVTCYNDYSRLNKELDGALDSQINTLGCAIGTGPLFTYVDYILANNMAFFNGTLAGGGEDKWRSQFNINIGFYW